MVIENKMIKYSLIELDKDLLPDYNDFERANNDWNVEKHLNLNYDINAAIAFSKLYFPTFIEYKNCIILESRFNETIFNDWFVKFEGDLIKIEQHCNLYETKDFFHINDSDQSIEKNKQLGELLKISWELSLKSLFPNRNSKVYLFEQDGNSYITISTLKNK